MTEPMHVAKYGVTLPITAEQFTAAQETRDAFNRWLLMSPEERAAGVQRERMRRAGQREAAETVALTLDTLLARMDRWGWSREYVEHLVQPYCGCEDGRDGWEFCEHARDLGLAP